MRTVRRLWRWVDWGNVGRAVVCAVVGLAGLAMVGALFAIALAPVWLPIVRSFRK